MSTTIYAPGINLNQALAEESEMTFQTVLISEHGLVLASDRMLLYRSSEGIGVYGDKETSVQRIKGTKIKTSGDVFYSFAGGPAAESIGRNIAMNVKASGYSDVEWQLHVESQANKLVGSDDSIMDEIFLIRKDTCKTALLLSKQYNRPSRLTSIEEHMCAGDKSSARWLPFHFYKRSLSLSALKYLAILTMFFAHKENPTNVSCDCDILTIDASGKIQQEYLEEETVSKYGNQFSLQISETIKNPVGQLKTRHFWRARLARLFAS